jgi:hypothetical protein
MTPEQQKMWDILRDEAYKYAVKSAADLKRYKSEKAMHKKADKYINYLLSLNQPIRAVCTLRLWLTTYKIPINPGMLTTFEPFHETYGEIIINLSKTKDFDLVFEKFIEHS